MSNEDRRWEIIGPFLLSERREGITFFANLTFKAFDLLIKEGLIDLVDKFEDVHSFMERHPEVTCHGYIVDGEFTKGYDYLRNLSLFGIHGIDF